VHLAKPRFIRRSTSTEKSPQLENIEAAQELAKLPANVETEESEKMDTAENESDASTGEVDPPETEAGS